MKSGRLAKRKRIENPELLEVVRSLPCMACGESPSHPHHVKTRGSGGDDIAENLMPLCNAHHTMIHAQGVTYMADKYPVVRNWLELAGWEFDEFMDHWTWRAPVVTPEA